MHPDDSPDQRLTPRRPGTPSGDAPSAGRPTGRHRGVGRRRRAGRDLLATTPARVALAAGVTCCLGVTAFVCTREDPDAARRPVAEALAERAADQERASRSLDRAATRGATPTPSATRAAPRTPAPPPRPRPVAGLTPAQLENARIIVAVGVELKMPRRALVVAVSTAMQESRLYNLASDVLPESNRYPHQGSGSDHDSLGLFQQRPSSGWGTVGELMRPAYAARAFYEALRDVPGWQRLSVADAAQAVQVSAYPDAYAPHERAATTVVAALT
ncbi:hypothetical protein [Micromonospora sp. KLBMP9576]|uniref:hypothetical protein n=1 Tax=Micromonospora sp. KLBMP9576 TaxID=3424769 RepID=UPI003D8CF891